MNRILASFSCALLFSGLALSQGVSGIWFFHPPRSGVQAIAGAPYSAEKIDENIQTLADGTHITRTLPVTRLYRDSVGRTREERPALRDTPEGPTVVEINDPVAHVRYVFSLNVNERVVHRTELPADQASVTFPSVRTVNAAGNVSGLAPVASRTGECETAQPPAVHAVAPFINTRPTVDDPNRVQMSSERLGTQIIEGVQVEGTRNTVTSPVGSVGNDRPITTTTETWRSPELQVEILRKSDDPRNGEHTYKLVNINRCDPDLSLFEPPPGYTVKDETGEFKINWVGPH
jgi:hypothetical protein